MPCFALSENSYSVDNSKVFVPFDRDVDVASDRPGSLIVDIAAATGGNTPFTKNNETVFYNGVTIIGNSNLPARMPSDASKLYGKNVLNFLNLIITKEPGIHLNWDDDLVKGSCITHAGEIVNERVKAV